MLLTVFKCLTLRRILALVRYTFIGLFIMDCLHLIYHNRIQPRLTFLFQRDVNWPSLEYYSSCEENTWWNKDNVVGLKPWQKITNEERNFPIAYTILAFERSDQVWRLLRSIYRPQNYYCIHFDKKSSSKMVQWLRKRVSSCIPRPENIIFIPSIPVYHSYMSVLEADLACMRELWSVKSDDGPKSSPTPPWKYVINLTGQEFPLKNNLELVKILRVLNGANLVEQLKFFWFRKSIQPPPHNLVLHKGAVHVVLSWEFVNFMFTESIVQDLLDYLPKVGTPDEAFFSTLNHNAKLNAPGNFPYGDREYQTGGYFFNRWKKFWPDTCKGEWRHAVCIFSLAGMKPIFEADSPYLFVNKFVMHLNADVMDITETWFYSRQDFIYRHQNVTLTDLDFFANLPQVVYQKRKQNTTHLPSEFD